MAETSSDSQNKMKAVCPPRQPNITERLGHAKPPTVDELFDASVIGDLEGMQAQFEAASLKVFMLKKEYENAAKDLYSMDQIIKKLREERQSDSTEKSSIATSQAVPDLTPDNIEEQIETALNDAGNQDDISTKDTEADTNMPKFVLSAAKRACTRKAVRVEDDHLLSQVCIVLVRTEGAVNIGQICRFAANIGVTDIRLVTPICDPLSSDGRRFAHHALPLLSALPKYQSLDDALADVDVVVGSSARDCAVALRGCEFIEPQDIASACVKEGIWGPNVQPSVQPSADMMSDADNDVPRPKSEFISSPRRVAILFGNEASGLSHAELSRANYCVYIPTRGAYPSLNLAHAVTVVMFSVWLTGHKRFFANTPDASQNSVLSQVATTKASLNEDGLVGRHHAVIYERASRQHVERLRALFEATMHRFGYKGAISMPGYFHDSTLRMARMCTMSATDLNLFFGAMKLINSTVDTIQSMTPSSLPSTGHLPPLELEKFLLGSVIEEEKAKARLIKEQKKAEKEKATKTSVEM